MKTKISIPLLGALFLAAKCHSQGTLQITFDGPPVYPPGSAISVTNYYESGMFFRPLPGSSGFTRVAPGYPGDPYDGTAFVRTALTESLMLSFTNGAAFGLVSVDLTEYSTVLPGSVTVPFIGYRPDGSTVTNSFTTAGYSGTGPLTFQTYYFGPEFSGVTRVAIPTSIWALDNLGVSVPEPTSGALLVAGALVLGLLKSRNQPAGRRQ